MGIFSKIGKALKKVAGAATGFLGGPWGAVAGAGFDYLLNKKSAKDAAKDAYKYSKKQLGDQFDLTRDLELSKYGWLVEGAQKAGFNPLTALGATGGPQLQGSPAAISPIAVQSYVGEALSTAAGNFQGPEDAIEKEGRILDNKLKMAKLAQMSSEVNRLGTPTGHALSPKQQKIVVENGDGYPVGWTTDPGISQAERVSPLDTSKGTGTASRDILVNPTVKDKDGEPVELEAAAMGAGVQQTLVPWAEEMLVSNWANRDGTAGGGKRYYERKKNEGSQKMIDQTLTDMGWRVPKGIPASQMWAHKRKGDMYRQQRAF